MRFFLAAAFMAVVLPAQVPYTRIVNANKEPQNWLTYSRTYDGQRYSPLAQITPANVARLKPLWTYSSSRWIILRLRRSQSTGSCMSPSRRTPFPPWMRAADAVYGDMFVQCPRISRYAVAVSTEASQFSTTRCTPAHSTHTFLPSTRGMERWSGIRQWPTTNQDTL